MSADTVSPLSEIEGAYEHALVALNQPERRLDAVVWLSAHLAAVEHVVYPVLRRKLGAGSPKVAALHRNGVDIEVALRTLERALSGDSSAVGLVDPDGHSDALTDLVADRAGAELALLEELAHRLDATEQRRLADSYQHTLEHAPTRPHPHSPHTGVLGSLAFHLNAWRDHVMDVMDGRRVPTPHPTVVKPKGGRWGDYLLGHGTDR